jgi:hypothetical protein
MNTLPSAGATRSVWAPSESRSEVPGGNRRGLNGSRPALLQLLQARDYQW